MIAAAVAVLPTSVAFGDLIIANAGFELVRDTDSNLVDLSTGGGTSGPGDEWNIVGGTVEGTVDNWDALAGSSTNGTQVRILNSLRANAPDSDNDDNWATITTGSLIGQNIGVVGDLGSSLVVTFDASNRGAATSSNIGDYIVRLFAGGAGTAGWTDGGAVELANVAVDSSTFAANLVTNTPDQGSDIGGIGAGNSVYYNDISVTLDSFADAGANTNVWLVFESTANTGNDQQLIDDVQIVPEPSSLALLAVGGALIGRRRRSAS